MEENMSCLAEVNSIICLNKKRKFQAEMPEMPLLKHVCWAQTKVNHDSSSDSTTKPKNVEINMFTRGESDPQSSKDNNSVHGDADSFMSPYTETCTTDEHSTSFASWSEGSSKMDNYSLESRSLTKSRPSKSDSLSIYEDPDYPSYSYEDHLQEFGNHADCIERFTDDGLENLLYSNGLVPNDYIPSSDAQQSAPTKLTIDKEFEQYFSSLML